MTECPDTQALLDQMTSELRSLLESRGIQQPLMIGIHTGGAWVARYLHEALGLQQPLGTLNITFYRDDFTRIGLHPQVEPSNLPFNIDDQHIILVDDVLFTGRTIRAAMNEIFDYGRPASIILAALVERPGRELPISADVAGTRMELAPEQQVKLSGPEPLILTLTETA